MGLNADALITVAEARIYCKLDSTDEPADAWFEAAINGVSAQIQAKTGHGYRPRDTSAATRTFDHNASRSIEIDDCTDIDRVRVTGTPSDASSFEQLDAADWLAEPIGSQVKNRIRFQGEGPLPAQNVGWAGLALFQQGSRATRWPGQDAAEARQLVIVEVRAKFGWPEVPGNIALAAMLWIQYLVKRDVAMFSPELAEATITQGTMPSDVKGILDTEHNKLASVGAV